MDINEGMKLLETYDKWLYVRLDNMRKAVECGEYDAARMITGDFAALAIKANTLANKLADA